uniref:transposase n=1 Tax=Streptomyces polyasparticus TaxID=2767826 RepID=UPI001F3383E5|nr:transposase [Streptomyces polyasparticus]
MFPGVVRRVGGDLVDRQQGAVQDDERLRSDVVCQSPYAGPSISSRPSSSQPTPPCGNNCQVWATLNSSDLRAFHRHEPSHGHLGRGIGAAGPRITLGLLAHRIGELSEQIHEADARLTRLVKRHPPQLLDVVGIGPDTAVALLITVGDNPERMDSEASFAALRGVSPVERSSGRRQYRRLNRGGDRQGNAALHRIVFTCLRVDQRTRDYCERRIKEGKTRREIVRCLERYAAREVFHLVRQLQPGPRS